MSDITYIVRQGKDKIRGNYHTLAWRKKSTRGGFGTYQLHAYFFEVDGFIVQQHALTKKIEHIYTEDKTIDQIIEEEKKRIHPHVRAYTSRK